MMKKEQRVESCKENTESELKNARYEGALYLRSRWQNDHYAQQGHESSHVMPLNCWWNHFEFELCY